MFPADEARPGAQAELLRVLQLQGMRDLRGPPRAFDVTGAREEEEAKDGDGKDTDKDRTSPRTRARARRSRAAKIEPRHFRAGSYIVRMDQPYSRIADMLLDYQYWSPNDPQKTSLRRHRLDVRRAVRRAGGARRRPAPCWTVRGGAGERGSEAAVRGRAARGRCWLVNHNTDIALATLRYRLKDAAFEAAEEPFEAGGVKFARGSFLIRGIGAAMRAGWPRSWA